MWVNNDGLVVKFGAEEAAVARGGEYNTGGHQEHVHEFVLDYKDMLSATASILGAATGTKTGSLGVMIPKGLRVEEIEFVVETAFTSSGTIGSATVALGLIREDRSTAYNATGFSTASATGTALGLATVGAKTVVRVGSTGAGALLGTMLANDGLVVVANTTHATNPFTAGKLRVRVLGYIPV